MREREREGRGRHDWREREWGLIKWCTEGSEERGFWFPRWDIGVYVFEGETAVSIEINLLFSLFSFSM